MDEDTKREIIAKLDSMNSYYANVLSELQSDNYVLDPNTLPDFTKHIQVTYKGIDISKYVSSIRMRKSSVLEEIDKELKQQAKQHQPVQKKSTKNSSTTKKKTTTKKKKTTKKK